MVLGAVVAAVMADGEYAPLAYEKKYDGYFQYANVPGPYEYEFGYNRGNPAHNRNQYEQSKDHRFRRKAIIWLGIHFDCIFEIQIFVCAGQSGW